MSVVQTKRVERQGNNGGYGVAERARGGGHGFGSVYIPAAADSESASLDNNSTRKRVIQFKLLS